MNLIECLLLGLALGADTFTVSLGLGLGHRFGWRRAVRLAAVFGGAAASLAGSGYAFAFAIQRTVAWLEQTPWLQVGALEPSQLAAKVHWTFTLIGSGLLGYLGLNLMGEYYAHSLGSQQRYRGRFAFALLAASVSVDAAMAGVGLGMLDEVNLGLIVATIGLCSGGLAACGLLTGRRLRRRTGRHAQLVGGLLLIALAAHFVLKTL